MLEMNRITISGYVFQKKNDTTPAIKVKSTNEKKEPSMVTFDLYQSVFTGKQGEKKGYFFHCMGLGSVAQRLVKAAKARCHITIDGKLQVRTNESNGKKFINTNIIVDDFSVAPETTPANA